MSGFFTDDSEDDNIFRGFGMTRDPFELFREFFASAGIDNVMSRAFTNPAADYSESIVRMPFRFGSSASGSSPINISSTRVSTQMVNGKTRTIRRYLLVFVNCHTW